ALLGLLHGLLKASGEAIDFGLAGFALLRLSRVLAAASDCLASRDADFLDLVFGCLQLDIQLGQALAIGGAGAGASRGLQINVFAGVARFVVAGLHAAEDFSALEDADEGVVIGGGNRIELVIVAAGAGDGESHDAASGHVELLVSRVHAELFLIPRIKALGSE